MYRTQPNIIGQPKPGIIVREILARYGQRYFGESLPQVIEKGRQTIENIVWKGEKSAIPNDMAYGILDLADQYGQNAFLYALGPEETPEPMPYRDGALRLPHLRRLLY